MRRQWIVNLGEWRLMRKALIVVRVFGPVTILKKWTENLLIGIKVMTTGNNNL